jgi:putative oxidoreductase
LQRLFSTFADGWPGRGLLLGRLLAGAALFHYGNTDLSDAYQFGPIAPQIIGTGAGILLLVGLWTPLAGALVATIEVWIAFSRPGDPWGSILLAALGATLAMVGPGAWSIDARLFGRKRINATERPRRSAMERGVVRVPPKSRSFRSHDPANTPADLMGLSTGGTGSKISEKNERNSPR